MWFFGYYGISNCYLYVNGIYYLFRCLFFKFFNGERVGLCNGFI